jgi:hypothetical protein
MINSICEICSHYWGRTQCHRYVHTCSKGYYEDDDYYPTKTFCDDFQKDNSDEKSKMNKNKEK